MSWRKGGASIGVIQTILNKIVDASAEAEYIFLKKQTAERSMIEYETRASVLKR